MQQTCHIILLASDAEHIEQEHRTTAHCNRAGESAVFFHSEKTQTGSGDIQLKPLPGLASFAVSPELRLQPVAHDLSVSVYSSMYKQADMLLRDQAGAGYLSAQADGICYGLMRTRLSYRCAME